MAVGTRSWRKLMFTSPRVLVRNARNSNGYLYLKIFIHNCDKLGKACNKTLLNVL